MDLTTLAILALFCLPGTALFVFVFSARARARKRAIAMLEGIGSALRLARTAPAPRIYGELVSICGMTELGSVRVLFTDNARMVKPSTRVSLAVGVGPTMALPGAMAQVDVPWLSVVGRDTLPRYALASCIATGDAAFDARFAVSVASGTSALTGVSFLQGSFRLSPELRQAMSTMVRAVHLRLRQILARPKASAVHERVELALLAVAIRVDARRCGAGFARSARAPCAKHRSPHGTASSSHRDDDYD